MPFTASLLAAIASALPGQVLPPARERPAVQGGSVLEYRTLPLPGGGVLEYALALPGGFTSDAARPVLVVLPPGDGSRARVEGDHAGRWGACAREHGFVVACPVAPGAGFAAPLLRRLRLDFRIDGARFDLAPATDAAPAALSLLREQPFEFRSLVVAPGVIDVAVAAGELARHGVVVREATARGLGTVLRELHESGIAGDPAVRAVGAVLDDFHSAAAQADEARYFAHFAPDGVFLGTDATERWTVAEFRAWAKPAFARESAWIFVPARRAVGVGPAADVAWFDEVAWSRSYGECRGSGVLRVVDGSWRVEQYNLTVPVPNELLGDVVARIRAHAAGGAAGAADAGVTTVWLVRHAEKGEGDDPELTEAGRRRVADLERVLRDVAFDAVFATELKRTQQTVAGIAARCGVAVTIVPAASVRDLAERVAGVRRGSTLLVAGHSNTLPRIARALGVVEEIEIGEHEHDLLLQVALDGAGRVRLVRLRFGD